MVFRFSNREKWNVGVDETANVQSPGFVNRNEKWGSMLYFYRFYGIR